MYFVINYVLRKYRPCVVGLLGMGKIICGVCYYWYKPSRSCPPSYCASPYILLFNLKNFLISILCVVGLCACTISDSVVFTVCKCSS